MHQNIISGMAYTLGVCPLRLKVGLLSVLYTLVFIYQEVEKTLSDNGDQECISRFATSMTSSGCCNVRNSQSFSKIIILAEQTIFSSDIGELVGHVG